MSYDPYLDIDWAIAQTNPDISHLLWLTDEEFNALKREAKNGKRVATRNIDRIAGNKKAA